MSSSITGAITAARKRILKLLESSKSVSVIWLISCKTPIDVKNPLIRDIRKEIVIEINKRESRTLHL